MKNRFNRRHRLPLGEDETSILAGALAMHASRSRRSASLPIVILVIVAPRMMVSRGVSPTLVRIGSDAHTAIRRMTTAASHDPAPHVFISFDHFPR
ncbi:hypothetical protein [Paraburkholderia sp. 22B1P]|uniref:hypothetical protein n=1 Tax=Paraburkholderia TaxID=1822464 RepID=UPI0030D53C0D